MSQLVQGQDLMIPERVKLVEKVKETPDTYTLTVKPLEREEFPEFKPGQLAMLYKFGVGEIPISFSGNPASRREWKFTVRAIGWVTKAIIASKKGENLGVRGPRGTSWPLKEAVGHDIVIVAGGLGLAPLRPVIYYIREHRNEYGEVHILYGARTPRDLLYKREFRGWSRKFHLLLTVDKADRRWRRNVGVVTTLFKKVKLDPDRSIAMVCGPEIMMRFTVMELNKLGIRSDRIYLSMERNMKCGLGICGRCQIGPYFVCKDGPVFRFDEIEKVFWIKEV